MIIIYRPPSSVPLPTFYREFSLLLEELATASGELLIVGDFNLHVDSSRDVNALHFCDLIASFDLKTMGDYADSHKWSYLGFNYY